MRAADTGIASIMQSVVGKVVVMDVAPDFSGGPIGKRVDLYQMELRVPLDLERACSGRGLLATDAGNPCAQLRQLLAERFDLSEIAAGIRIAAPERGTIRTFLIFGRERRREFLDFHLISLFNLLHQAIGLGEQKISVEREDAESRLYFPGNVNEY